MILFKQDEHGDMDGSTEHSLRHLICEISGLATLLFCCLPLLIPGLPMGSDDTFHLGRFYALGMAIRNGIFPAQIRPSLCYGYGYGVGFFYADFFLYLPALLIAVGVPTVIVVKIYVLLVFFLIMAVMYRMTKEIIGNADIALLCACLYVLSNKVFGQYYLEFSIGCFTAAAFVPLAFGGLYLILTKDKGWKAFIAGCLGCVGTHVITTVLVAVICFLMLCLKGGKLIRNPKSFRKFALSLAFMMLITGAYWLPMLEQFRTLRLKSSTHWTVEEDNVASFRHMVEYRGIGIGILLCVALAVALFLMNIRYRKSFPDGAVLFGGLGGLYLLLPSCRLFWHLMNKRISLIQFPDRLYQPAVVLLLFSLGCLLAKTNCFIPKEVNRKDRSTAQRESREGNIENQGVDCADAGRNYGPAVCLILCVSLVAVSMISDIKEYYLCPEVRFGYDDVELVQNGSIACAGSGQEWMPLEVNTDTLKTPEIAVGASGQQVKGCKTKGDSVFTFWADTEEEWYDVPFIHYQGYRAVDENGQEYVTTGDPENGLLRILLPENHDAKGENVTITVKYSWTKWQMAGYVLSLLGVIFGISYYWRKNQLISRGKRS